MTNGSFPVPQSAVEEGLLSASAGNMQRWLEVSSCFDVDDFVSSREIFRFFGTYLAQYGSLPSSSQLNVRFSWAPPIGDYAYWLNEMKRYALARRVLEAIQQGYQNISDPDRALNLLMNQLSLIRSQQNHHVQASDTTAFERLERFDYRTEHILNAKQIVGIRTGISILDDSLVGYVPGSLVCNYARPSVGKTWWLLWSGMNAWADGKTVLAVTPEMPANMLNLRIDVLAGAALGYPLDYSKLLIGDPSIRENYAIVTDIMKQSSRWWTYDSYEGRPLSLSEIAALVRQHHPDILLIDGVSLLRYEGRGQSTWEQIREICYGLKNMATINELPILFTHQAVNSNRGRRTEITLTGRGDDFVMPSLSDAAFGDSVAQATSDVITMVGDSVDPNVTWFSLRKTRERGFAQPLPPRMAFITDFGHGIIHDLSYLGHNPEAVGQEARRILGR